MRFHIQLLAQPSMLSLDEKLRELDDLPVDISTHFHTAKHIRIGDQHILKWTHSKLCFAVEYTGERFMVHGRLLASAAAAHAETSGYFTFFPSTNAKVGFDLEITTTQELEDARAELKKLWWVQFNQELALGE